MTEEASAPTTAPHAARQRYSTVAIWLHWLIALAIAFQLALGFAMPKGAEGFALYQLHKSVGIAILLLTLVRLAWRLTHRPPPAAEGGFTGFLARAVHVGFYAFMVLTPLTGWALVSTDPLDIPTVLFGTIPWPHLPLPSSLNDAMEGAHGLLAGLGILLFLLHVVGALRHQFLLKDRLLVRMAPGGKGWAALALLAAVIATYFGTGMYVASKYLVPSLERQATAEAEAPVAGPSLDVTLTEDATPQAEAVAEPEAAEPGPPPVWAIQPGGRLAFSIRNGDSTLNGSFPDWDGTIRFDPDNPESADIRINVRLASTTLGDATQDSMLRDADFFATAANPVANWRSTSVSRIGTNSYSASGTLSLKGVSRPQSLNFTLSGTGLRRRVEGSATIDRTAFGVGTGEAATGLTPTVSLNFSFDATGREQ